MVRAIADFFTTTSPTPAEIDIARHSSRQLATLLGKYPENSHGLNIKLQVQTENDSEEVIVIPRAALHLLTTILTQMSIGNAITLMPVDAELTIQQAADILNVSHSFLSRLLDEAQIPYRGAGSRRRIRLEDLMRYKKDIDQKRLQALEELSQEAQELDMGY